MDRNRLAFIALFAFLLSACTVNGTGYGGSYQAQQIPLEAARATYQAAANSATAQAASAQHTAVAATAQVSQQQTAVAATSTRAAEIPTETAQAKQQQTAVAATETIGASEAEAQALINQASAQGTAQAIALLSEFDKSLVEDERHRIEIEHQADLAEIEKDRAWSLLYRVIAGAIIVSTIILIGVVIWLMYQKSKPVVVERGPNLPPTILLPEGVSPFALRGFKQLAPPRQTAVDDNTIEGEIIDIPEQQLVPINKNHFMVVGPTEAGKSTAMRFILHGRRMDGHRLIALDPHYEPGAWLDAEVYGGGRNFGEIEQFMAWMMDELNGRAQMLAQGHKDWGQPITVATDEMPAITDELGKDTAKIWKRWIREGRKFDLYFALSTQSDRVRTLGIEGEGDVLRNFGAVLYLGQTAVDKFGAITKRQTRPAVLNTLRGPKPVIVPNMQTNGQIISSGPAIAAPQINNGLSTPQNVGLQTEWGFISPTQIRQIEDMTKQGQSGRAIEDATFGYEGGAAYNMRKFVVEALRI